LARRQGATAQQIEALNRGHLADFDPAWAAALQVAAMSTSDRGQVSDEAYASLEAHWTPGQIIEIIAVIGLFNYFNRFAIGLDIPPTK
jgi:alkylhydroperoxidase family enzyme